MNFGCKLSCPDGTDFRFPASDWYKCDYSTGRWTPSPIPECNYGKYIEKICIYYLIYIYLRYIR